MAVRLGLQLYSVRTALEADPWGTLDRVADAGFTALEGANHAARTDPGLGFGVDATELRTRLADLGMRIVGCHVNPLDEDILPRALDYQQALGNTQIGCDIEFYPYGDRDAVLGRCEVFDRVGQLCADRGMRFYYHNHFQEFQTVAGPDGESTVYDLIMANTDPRLVFCEIDTYWVYRGGADPVALMQRYADRVILLHQKDFPADARQPLNLFDGVVSPTQDITGDVFEGVKDPLCFVEIGTGTLPIQDIVDAAAGLPNFEYLLLEQDHTTLDEIDSIQTSREACGRYRGVQFD